jgi:hypothetical protein
MQKVAALQRLVGDGEPVIARFESGPGGIAHS